MKYLDVFGVNTYVINMEKDVQRMETVKLELDKQKIPFTRIEASTSNEMNLPVLNKSLPKGFIGSFTSHYKLIKRQSDSEIPLCTILEDDAEFHPDFHNLFENCFEQLLQIDREWDILLYGTCVPGNVYTLNFFKKINEYITGQKSNVKISENIYRCFSVLGLQGYSVSLKGARKFLDIIKHIDMLDKLMGQMCVKHNDFKVYLVEHPQLIIQKTLLFGSNNVKAIHPYLLNRLLDKINLYSLVDKEKTSFKSQFSLAYGSNVNLIDIPLYGDVKGNHIIIFIMYFILGKISIQLAILLLILMLSTDYIYTKKIGIREMIISILAIYIGNIV